MWPIPLPRLFSGIETHRRCCVRETEIEPALRGALEASGFLAFAGIDTRYHCSDCDEGSCPVVPVSERDDGATVYHVLCQRGDVIMTDDRALTSWQYSAHSVANALARFLGVGQVATPVIPQRLWALGESTFAGTSVSWFLGVGITRPDALAAFGGAPALQSARLAVVLTPTDIPAVDGFASHVVIWPFSTLLHVAHGEIRFHPEALEALARAVVSRDTTPRSTTTKARKWLDVPAGTTWEQVIITIVNTDAITIQAPGTPRGETFTYDEIGWWDTRTSDPETDQFTPDATWRRWLRFAYLYVPTEQVSKAQWAGEENDQLDHVKTWAYQINLRFNSLLRGIAPTPAPIVGKRGVYTTSFRLVVETQFRRELEKRHAHHSR